MSQKVLIAIIGIAIVALIILTFLVGEGKNILTRLLPQPTPTPTPAVFVAPPTPTPISGDTIMFTGLRFTPITLELKLGQVVNIANVGEEPIEIMSKTEGEEGRKLSVGLIKAGETSQLIKFEKPGVYEYYIKSDPTNPNTQGRIIVK